ncbi:hypothetical protein BT96DRAFT_820316 [Gymnopus androsaceus JB14]|uniref:HTH cro/C1-type domain-containing protein n=1 Tax=Gymnopus androsaceus JB14 TaxID=1447944 RepID=A0A6A4HL19_9AGAR|nr:hypothetical protein BT96DRAFT_820316 [Gymnopus androsaceus JB14]
MAPDPQCAALNAAKTRTGMSYAEIAAKIGQPEKHVIDVCTAKTKPTEAEFKALATALGITDNVPHSGVHATV